MGDSANALQELAELPYLPAKTNYKPDIGLIGCGGISKYHLMACQNAGLNVAAVCDLNVASAQEVASKYYPDAVVYQDYQDLIRLENVEVVDITTHPPERPTIVADALRAGKHVLSQKPFVLDLDVGLELIDLADRCDRYLAVNQNGRWAPHFSFARQVAKSGIIGDIFGVHLGCHWDHRWVEGTEFENVKQLILYDYAIHWFDIVRAFLPGEVKRVFASTARVPAQKLMPDLLAQAAIEFDQGQATLAFDAAVPYGFWEETYLGGTLGALHSGGTGNQDQTVSVTTELGTFTPSLKGKWFPDGFEGTICELLCAIDERRTCSIDAKDNLESLALCFAAIHSAETGMPVKPGTVRKLPD